MSSSGAARRIVSLACTHTETLHALGVASQLVGVDCFSDFPRQLTDGLPKIDPWLSEFEVERAKIEALQPDLLVLSYPFQGELLAAKPLDGVEVVTLDAPTGKEWMQEMFEQFRLLGEKVGASAAAEAIISNMSADFEQIKQTRPSKADLTFFLEMDHCLYSAGRESLVSRVLTDVVGLQNCVEGDELYPQLSTEHVVGLRPSLWFVAHNDEQTFAESQPEAAARLTARGVNLTLKMVY